MNYKVIYYFIVTFLLVTKVHSILDSVKLISYFKTNNNNEENVWEKLLLLKKSEYSINTFGWRCQKYIYGREKLQFKYSYKYTPMLEDECRLMVTNKLCLDDSNKFAKMTCDSNNEKCESHHFETSDGKVRKCSIEQVLLKGSNDLISMNGNETIEQIELCKFKYLTCINGNSRLIWNYTSQSYFRIITELKLKKLLNNYYLSNELEIGFKIIGNFTENKILIYNTTSQYYVAHSFYKKRFQISNEVLDLNVLKNNYEKLRIDYLFEVLNQNSKGN